MPKAWIAAALVGQTFLLSNGVRTRLRLARFSEAGAIGELLSRQGLDLEAHRLVQFDPRARYVICAMALVDSNERVIGVGAIDLAADGADQPDLLIVDPEIGEPVAQLLSHVLVGAAQTAAGVRAA